MTGYELKKLFDVSIAHFWNGELSHIYSTLKHLESDGLADVEVDVQTDRPNRKVYSITDDGRRELNDWLASPPEPEQVREPVLVKVFFGASLSKPSKAALTRSPALSTPSPNACAQVAACTISGPAPAAGWPHWTRPSARRLSASSRAQSPPMTPGTARPRTTAGAARRKPGRRGSGPPTPSSASAPAAARATCWPRWPRPAPPAAWSSA